MNMLHTRARPAVLRFALAVTGVMAAATMAHGQGAPEPGAPVAKMPPKVVSKAERRQKSSTIIKTAELVATAPMTGKVEQAKQIDLAVGKSTLMRLPYPAARVSVGDSNIADVILLNSSDAYFLGKSVGSTNLILWSRANDATVFPITVGIDIDALQGRLDLLLPSETNNIKVKSVADTIVLYGTVSDVVKADQALELANAYVRQVARAGQAQQQLAVAGALGGTSAPAQQQIAMASGGMGTSTAGVQQSNGALAASIGGSAPSNGGGGPKVINMLSIAAPQQVMLEVKVAEVSKSLVDQLGASIGATKTLGNWTYSLLSNLLGNSPSLVDAFSKKNGNFVTLDAQKTDGLVKVLAEPTIMAISGQEASFVAGGKIYIPVSQNSNGGGSTISLEEKEFGISVKFTPTVLDGGRINLKVAPEVSDLNKDGIGIAASGISGTAILPSFTTRRASTTVQLRDGQSFAIGGLIKNNVTTSIKAFPFLGEIPVLGALFRSSDFQTDRSELVFIITPHLVKPLPADFKLPTDPYIEPSRSEFFLGGKMEGSTPKQVKSPIGPASGFEIK